MAKSLVKQLPNGMIEHADGVWFNQRFDNYLNDTAIGSHDLLQILKSPVEWWWYSRWNPLRPPESIKKALLRGVAAHVHFLDGPKAYDRAYAIKPDHESHPKALDTMLQIKAEARKHGVPFSSADTKPMVIAKMVKAGHGGKILEVLREQFDRTGKLAISRADDAVIKILYRLAMRTRDELGLGKGKLVPRDALIGGVHEVSVFWTDADGIRQRARFDKLKPMISLDLKTIADWRHGNFDTDLLEEAARRGYFLQWAHYDEARIQLIKAVKEGRVYGATKTQMARLQEIAKSDEWAWVWMFIKTDGAPRVKAIVPSRDAGHYLRAVQDRQAALGKFIFHREQFGMTNTWIDTEVVWVPEHHQYPAFYN